MMDNKTIMNFLQATLIYIFIRRLLPFSILNEKIDMNKVIVQSLCYALAGVISSEITRIRTKKQESNQE